MTNLEKNTSLDDADIQFGPLKIQTENVEFLKVGNFLQTSKVEDIVIQIGKRKIKTLRKSFYHAGNTWDYWLNTYKIENNDLINESSILISERKYNNYLNSIKQTTN